MFDKNLLLFVTASLALIVVPGPDMIYVLTRGVSQGRLAGLVSAAGVCSGVLVHTAVAAVGLSAILAQSAVAFSVVKYAGAAYLVYLGISHSWRRSNPEQRHARQRDPTRANKKPGSPTRDSARVLSQTERAVNTTNAPAATQNSTVRKRIVDPNTRTSHLILPIMTHKAHVGQIARWGCARVVRADRSHQHGLSRIILEPVKRITVSSELCATLSRV